VIQERVIRKSLETRCAGAVHGRTFLKEIAGSAARISLAIRQMGALRGKLVLFNPQGRGRDSFTLVDGHEQVLGSRLNEASSGNRRGNSAAAHIRLKLVQPVRR
jgi:hypothetical protein